MRSKAELFECIKIIILICAMMASVHLLNILTDGYFLNFGLEPRELSRIYAILLYPWLHGDMTHLLSNLSIFVVLAFLCLMQGVRYFVKASAIIIIVSGLLVWLFGRDAIHIGASGWIFGLWSLTIALAWFERSFLNISVGIGVLIFYGGMIFGLVPTSAPVSFEGHIFGAMAGVISAAILSKERRLRLKKTPNGELQFWSDN